MGLKEQIVGACQVCNGTEFVGSELCECVLKFRAYNRLHDKGFSLPTLDLVSNTRYVYPVFEDGLNAVNYWLMHLDVVLEKGLSLFIFSEERGRGKTTLAHKLAYEFAKYFSHTTRYSRSTSFGFEHIDDKLQTLKTKDPSDVYKSTLYILDDLGNEDTSATWKKELVVSNLQACLHHRRDRRLPTIITSNFPPSEIGSRYGQKLNSLLEITENGDIRGMLFRQAKLGGAEDLRLITPSEWPE